MDFCCGQESKIFVHDTYIYSEGESSQGAGKGGKKIERIMAWP